MGTFADYHAITPRVEGPSLATSVCGAFEAAKFHGRKSIALEPNIAARAFLALDPVFNGWQRDLAYFEEAFVPSLWMAEQLEATRTFRTPVTYEAIPFAFDAITAKRRRRGQKLRFLFLASHTDQQRKGVDLAKAAFTAAFGSREDVELVIHSTYPAPFLTINAPNINASGGRLYGDEYATFLHGFDALIHPARCESIGLTVAEAIASGMPAIHSGATGMAEYREYGFTCTHRSVRTRDGFEWREPYLDTIVDALKTIENDYDATMKRAITQAKAIRQREESVDGRTPQSADVSLAT